MNHLEANLSDLRSLVQLFRDDTNNRADHISVQPFTKVRNVSITKWIATKG